MRMTQGNIGELSTPLDQQTRDACMHQLGALYDAGAMSMEELDTRICAAMVAETREELVEVVRDLVESQSESTRPTGASAPSTPTIDRDAPPRPAANPRTARLASGAKRSVGLVGAGAAVVIVASVVLGSVLPVVVYVSALVGSFVLRTSGGRLDTTGSATDLADEPTPADVRPSQDLAVLPRAAVPAQRTAGKVHPVVVPVDERVASTDPDLDLDTAVAPRKLIVPSVRELPSAERPALGTGRTASQNADHIAVPAQAEAPAAESYVPDAASPARPFMDRVTDRSWIREHVRRGQAASRIRSS